MNRKAAKFVVTYSTGASATYLSFRSLQSFLEWAAKYGGQATADELADQLAEAQTGDYALLTVVLANVERDVLVFVGRDRLGGVHFYGYGVQGEDDDESGRKTAVG